MLLKQGSSIWSVLGPPLDVEIWALVVEVYNWTGHNFLDFPLVAACA